MASDAFFAGGISGTIGLMATQPFDVIKVRQQVGGGSILHNARDLISKQGVSSLWKGLLMPCSTNGLQCALLFLAYEKTLDGFELSRNAPINHFFAGCTAGVAAVFLICPSELIKCIAQVDNRPASFKTDILITKKILQTDGPRGLFRGLPITMIRDVPSFGLYFYVYEMLQQNLGWGTFVSGGWAGVASWVCVYPLDVIKTSWQVASPAERASVGTFATELTARFKQQGGVVRSLTRGLGSCVLRAWPQHAVTFTVYEYIKSIDASLSFSSLSGCSKALFA